MWVEFCDWQQVHKQTLCFGKESWQRYIHSDISRRTVWVIAEHSMAAAFVYTTPALPVSNSLFVKLFGIICIWRIPYKTGIYSFLCYAFGAWHIRVLLYATCWKLSTQLLLTPLGTGLLASIWGSGKGLTGTQVNWNKDRVELRYLFSCWKFYGQQGYK